MNVGVCMPLTKELGVLSDHLAEYSSHDAWLLIPGSVPG
jgi:hypothetical protein